MSDQENATLVRETARRICPILAGLEPGIQSAVIADLTARWLAGNHVPGNINATSEFRTALLSDWLELVRELIDINAKAIGTTPSDPQP